MQRKSEKEKAAEVLLAAQRPPPSPNPKSRSRTFFQKNIRSRNARRRRPESAFASTLRSMLCIITFGCIGKSKKKSRGQKKCERSKEDRTEDAMVLPRPITLEELVKLTAQEEESKENDSLESYSTTEDESSMCGGLEEFTDEEMSSKQSVCMDQSARDTADCTTSQEWMDRDTSSEQSVLKETTDDVMMLPRPVELEEMLDMMNCEEKSMKTTHSEPCNDLRGDSRAYKRAEKSRDEAATEQSVCMVTAENTVMLPRPVMLEDMSEVMNRLIECEKNDHSNLGNETSGERRGCEILESSMNENASSKQSDRKRTAEDEMMLQRLVDLEEMLDLMDRQEERMKNGQVKPCNGAGGFSRVYKRRTKSSDEYTGATTLVCMNEAEDGALSSRPDVLKNMLEVINRLEEGEKNSHLVAAKDAITPPRPEGQKEMLELIDHQEKGMKTNHLDTAEDATMLPRPVELEDMLELIDCQRENMKTNHLEPRNKTRGESRMCKRLERTTDENVATMQLACMQEELDEPISELMEETSDLLEIKDKEPKNATHTDRGDFFEIPKESSNQELGSLLEPTNERTDFELKGLLPIVEKLSILTRALGKKENEECSSTFDLGHGNAFEIADNASDRELKKPLKDHAIARKHYLLAGAKCGRFDSSAGKTKVMKGHPNSTMESIRAISNLLDQLESMPHSSGSVKRSEVTSHPRQEICSDNVGTEAATPFETIFLYKNFVKLYMRV